jgi:hypothetical protein
MAKRYKLPMNALKFLVSVKVIEFHIMDIYSYLDLVSEAYKIFNCKEYKMKM